MRDISKPGMNRRFKTSQRRLDSQPKLVYNYTVECKMVHGQEVSVKVYEAPTPKEERTIPAFPIVTNRELQCQH